MLIVMTNTATEAQIEAVCDRVRSLGLEAHCMPGAQRTAVCITGNNGSVAARHFIDLPGILEVIRVSKPYKLTSIETKSTPTVISLKGVTIGGADLAVIAGPLYLDEPQRMLDMAKQLKDMGVRLFRSSVYLPQHNPYFAKKSVIEGLEVLEAVRALGLAMITEIAEPQDIEVLDPVCDAWLVESHNMQNFTLLKALGKTRKPVILKRNVAADIEAWLMSAEYIMAGGNHEVVLCESGVRSFVQHSAYTLDLAVVPVLKKLTHLPIIVDPSFAAGNLHSVSALARAAVVVGADGVLLECHSEPRRALFGGQALDLTQLSEQLPKLQALRHI